jgi:hypothetical protein
MGMRYREPQPYTSVYINRYNGVSMCGCVWSQQGGGGGGSVVLLYNTASRAGGDELVS